MPESMEVRKWCAIVKLEGYTTPESARALVEKFHEIVGTFEDAGVDLDVFLFLEGLDNPESKERPVPRKPNRLEER